MSAPSLEDLEKGSSLGHDAWLRLRKNRLAVIGGLMLIFIALFCLLGPMFSPYGYEEDHILTGAAPPSNQAFHTETAESASSNNSNPSSPVYPVPPIMQVSEPILIERT